jgi:hypothetical protein
VSFADGYSGTRQASAPDYGGGAIFDRGGQLTVVNSAFTDNTCSTGGAVSGLYRRRHLQPDHRGHRDQR